MVPLTVKVLNIMLPFMVEPKMVTLSPISTPNFSAKSLLIRTSPCLVGIEPFTIDLTIFILSASFEPGDNKSMAFPAAGP